jgi:hypothetical protein
MILHICSLSDCLRLSLWDRLRNLNIGYIRRPLTMCIWPHSIGLRFLPSVFNLSSGSQIYPNTESPLLHKLHCFHTLWQLVSSFGMLYKWNKNVKCVSQYYKCSQKMPTLQMAHSIMHYIKLYTFLIGLDKLTSGLVVHFSCYLQSD